MRDPNRIKPMMEALEELWNEYPDYRLGQLVINLARLYHEYDPFYIEDDVMLERIKRSNIHGRTWK